MHLLGREKLAESFGEQLSLRPPREEQQQQLGEKTDFTDQARICLNLVIQLKSMDKQVTLLQLVDLWKGQGVH